MPRSLLALLGCLPALVLAQSEPVYVGAEVKPNRCAVGETVAYNVYVGADNRRPNELKVQPPVFDGFQTVGQPVREKSEQPGDTTFVYRFTLRPTREGRLLIGPTTVTYTGRDGRPARTAGPAVALEVGPRAITTDIRPARAPLLAKDALAAWRTALIVLAGLLLAGLVGGGLVRFIARRPPAPAPPATPELPAHATALRRLAELEAEELPAKGHIDEYHVRLSLIVRDYLGERYRFHAPESTTSEIARRLYQRQAAAEVIVRAKTLLDACDRVKFAEHAPTVEDMGERLADARALVVAARGPAGEAG